MNKIFEISNLRKDYKGFSLEDISMSLEKGYVMGFIGPNGAGKTTTIKLMMNLLRRDNGEIKIFGLDNIREERKVKERIGFVFDENYLYEELTMNEMKRIIASFYECWDESTYQKCMGDFDLDPRKKIKQLSKGMKTKFSLAMALSHQAELLIMDEPTSGLDPIFRSELLDILRTFMTEENRGIIFSTHVTSDLDKIADFVTFINKGRIVLSCSMAEVQERFGLVKGEKGQLNDAVREELIGLRESKVGFLGLTAKRDELMIRHKDLVIERPTLEDVMLHMVRSDKDVASHS